MQYFLIKIYIFLTFLAISGCFFSKDAQRWYLATNGATCFSLSKDGRFALLASQPEGIALWDLLDNKKLAAFGYHDANSGTITDCSISDNNRYAITATSQNFSVWDLAWSKSQGLWSLSDAHIQDVAISNNGARIALALSNNKALYINLESGRRMEFLAHQKRVNTVSISPNGRFVLSGGDDKNAYLWNSKTGQILYHFPHQSKVNQVAMHREGNYAFSSDISGNGAIWHLPSGKKITELKTFHRFSNFSCARFSNDGEQLVTGTPSRRVEYWQTQTGKKIASWTAKAKKGVHPPSAVVYDAALDNMGRIIAASSAGIAEAWKIE